MLRLVETPPEVSSQSVAAPSLLSQRQQACGANPITPSPQPRYGSRVMPRGAARSIGSAAEAEAAAVGALSGSRGRKKSLTTGAATTTVQRCVFWGGEGGRGELYVSYMSWRWLAPTQAGIYLSLRLSLAL